MAVIKITAAWMAQLMLELASDCSRCRARDHCSGCGFCSHKCFDTLETYLTSKYGEGDQQERAIKELEEMR